MTTLLDASALLALLHEEAGAAVVEEHVSDAALLAVNLEEVVGILVKEGMAVSAVRDVLGPLALSIVPFTEEMAWSAGAARPSLPSRLGVADRCCLAAASILKVRVLTADSLWRDVAHVFRADVVLIR